MCIVFLAAAAEILKFRDFAWNKYHTDPSYLNLLEKKFGIHARKNLEETTKINERDPYLIQNDDNSQNRAVSSQSDEDTAQVNYSYGSKPNLQEVLEPSSIGNNSKTRPNEGLVGEAEDDDDDNDINGNR